MIPPFRREFDAARDPDAAQFALNLCKLKIWTPTVTFVTPGDVSVVYSVRIGRYIKIGQFVIVWFQIQTSTFTHTTASGSLLITGLPFTPTNAIVFTGGIADTTGLIPGANITMAGCEITSGSIGIITNNLVTGARSFMNDTSHTTGTNCILRGNISYCTA